MFYVDEVRSGRATLRGETVQHLRKVLRAEAGQRFEISDNETLYLAELTSYGKDLVDFTVISEIETPRPPVRLHLFPALIKFDRFEWVLEKATELGVERITPVYALRSDKGLDQAAVKRLDRWKKGLAESGQQSRPARHRSTRHPCRGTRRTGIIPLFSRRRPRRAPAAQIDSVPAHIHRRGRPSLRT